MEAKRDSKYESKEDQKAYKQFQDDYVDETLFCDEKSAERKSGVEDCGDSSLRPAVNILEINISPNDLVDIDAALELSIKFDIDQDIVAGYWIVQFLVDSARSRMIKTLGETHVEDFTEGENEMVFKVDRINVDGIEPSSLTNSGLLMAKLMANGDEIISVNMVRAAVVLVSLRC